MEENGFDQPENQFSLVKIWSFIKNWRPLTSVTVSTQRKTLNKRKRFHQPENPLKDFVEIQYSVLQKLCFDQIYFCLVETIIGIRVKQFSKRQIILASGKVIFRLLETIFFSIFWGPLPVFFRLVEKYFSRKSLSSASLNGVQS